MDTSNRVGLDVDGPLYPVHDILSDMVGKKTTLSHWQFYKEWGMQESEFDELYADAILNHDLFLRKPMTYGVKSTIGLLKDMGYEIILCTVRGVGLPQKVEEAAQSQTVQWLKENKVPYDEVIFSTDKNDANSFCFFDDNIQNYEALERAQRSIPWLYTLPYNESYGGRRVYSFRSIPGAVVWSAKHRRDKNNNGSRPIRKEFLV